MSFSRKLVRFIALITSFTGLKHLLTNAPQIRYNGDQFIQLDGHADMLENG